jgi:hypothetical protein
MLQRYYRGKKDMTEEELREYNRKSAKRMRETRARRRSELQGI